MAIDHRRVGVCHRHARERLVQTVGTGIHLAIKHLIHNRTGAQPPVQLDVIGIIHARQVLRRARDRRHHRLAVDATGLSRTTVSDYFTSRRGRKFRRWVKVGVVILTGSLLPVALAVDLKPTHDCVQARALLPQAQAASQPAKLYADAGYDAEWIHTQCREQWGVASVIPTNPRRVGRPAGGNWRSQMTPEYLAEQGYRQRWKVESFFSALKRTMGSTLSARQPKQLAAEAALKVLAYALRR